jgi:general secretion pathway protein M
MSRSALTVWYAQLAPRDRRILNIGAVVVALILIFWVMFPLQRSLSLAREELRDKQANLEEMRGMAPTLAAAGPGQPATPVPAGNGSIVVLIDTSARESGLAKALTGSTPAGNGAMRVQLEQADFNLVIGWLHRLSTQHGLRIEDATFTDTGGAGLVNLSVQLRPGK